MPKEKTKDKKTWKINGFLIHVEQYDSVMIVKDENGNNSRISKQDKQPVVLNLNGISTSSKNQSHKVKKLKRNRFRKEENLPKSLSDF